MTMRLLYIAGPCSGKTPWHVQCNIHRALELSASVVTQRPGWFPVCPMSNTPHFDGLADDHYFLDGTLELMRRCDAVLMMPDWQASKGAIGEYQEAVRLGIPVYYSLMDVPKIGAVKHD